MAASATAATRTFTWDDLQKQGRVSAGTVLPPEAGSRDARLEIKNDSSAPMTATVLTIEQPPVTGPQYRLSGRVRYEGVDGTGYLEMWNYFAGGGQYFSRTMAEQGPMMKLQGTSAWRSFAVPFDGTGAAPPIRLVVNVVLPARGTVYLGPVELSDDGGAASTRFNAPSSGRVAGMAGGVAGSLIGGLGALIGVLVSLGRARRFVIASAVGLVACGAVAFVAAVIAFASEGAHSSAYPVLLLISLVSSVVPLILLPVIRRRYEEIELRVMRAHDLGQG